MDDFEPVGGFDDACGLVDHGALFGLEVVDHDLAAVEGTLFDLRALESDAREDGSLDDVCIVRGDAETDIDGVGEFEGQGFAGEDCKGIAAALDSEAGGAFGGGTMLGGWAAFDGTVLQRGEAVTVDGYVGVG